MIESIVPESGRDRGSPQGVSEPVAPESKQPPNANPLPEKPKSKGRGPGRPFQKGKSGNPKGRPRNGSSLTVLLHKKIAQICEYDKQQRTWEDMLVVATLRLAMEGNPSALRVVWERLGGQVPPPSPEEEARDPTLRVEFVHSPFQNSQPDGSTSPDTPGPRT